eukprot:Gb_28714 [translate_table: standard]
MEQPRKIIELDTTCTWQTPEPNVKAGCPLVEELLPDLAIGTRLATKLATGMRNDFSKPILEGLHKLMLDDREEQPLRCSSEEGLPRDKGDIVSEDPKPGKILKSLRTPFNMHKNPLYTKSFAMATQEKTSAFGVHPKESKPQPFRANSSCLNAGNSTRSPTPSANPNPFNMFIGGPTSQMPTFQTFNPFATCGPTSSMGQTNLVILRLPNYGYGFRYTSYPVPGYQLNNMMQCSMPGNSFGFGGPFALSFTNNGTLCMLNSNNNYRGIDNNDNSGNNGHNGNIGNINDGSNTFNNPNMFQFPNTSLQQLKYEGYVDPFEHLALLLNNIVQRGITNEVAIKQGFFSTLRGIALQWYECVKDNSNERAIPRLLPDTVQPINNLQSPSRKQASYGRNSMEL